MQRIAIGLCGLILLGSNLLGELLPGAKPLTITNELTDLYISGLDCFALDATERVVATRKAQWQRELAKGGVAAQAWLATNRAELARITGVIDKRVPFDAPETIGTVDKPDFLGEGATHTLWRIRWPVLGDFMAEGLLLQPKGEQIRESVVYLPHGGVAPEEVLGLWGNGGAYRV